MSNEVFSFLDNTDQCSAHADISHVGPIHCATQLHGEHVRYLRVLCQGVIEWFNGVVRLSETKMGGILFTTIQLLLQSALP